MGNSANAERLEGIPVPTGLDDSSQQDEFDFEEPDITKFFDFDQPVERVGLDSGEQPDDFFRFLQDEMTASDKAEKAPSLVLSDQVWKGSSMGAAAKGTDKKVSYSVGCWSRGP